MVPPTGIAVGCDGHVLAVTAGFAGSSRSPNTSSVRLLSTRVSGAVFAIETVNITGAPGSGTVPRLGVLVTEAVGKDVSERDCGEVV